MSSKNTTFPEVIQNYIAKATKDIHTALPGRIESYDPTTQKADVKPLIKSENVLEDGTIEYLPIPVIPNVPVAFPGGNGFMVTFPLTKGDTCLIIFSEASLDTWLSKGGDVEPSVATRHDFSDAVIYPGLKSFKNPLNNASGDNMIVGADNGTSMIEISVSEVVVGGAGAEPLIPLSDFLAHTHSSAMGPTGVPLDPNVGTSILKGK